MATRKDTARALNDLRAYKRFQRAAFSARRFEQDVKLEPLMPYEEQFKGGFDANAEDALNATLAGQV